MRKNPEIPDAVVTLRRNGKPRTIRLDQIPRKKQWVGAEVYLPGDPRPWRIFKIDFPPGWGMTG